LEAGDGEEDGVLVAVKLERSSVPNLVEIGRLVDFLVTDEVEAEDLGGELDGHGAEDRGEDRDADEGGLRHVGGEVRVSLRLPHQHREGHQDRQVYV